MSSELTEMMNTVAETLKEPGDLTETLRRITFTARDMVPRADYVSISIRRDDDVLETVAATDEVVSSADELQSSLHEGPCYPLDAGERVVYSGNVALDPRWPSYGPQVARLGIASQLAMTLHMEPGAHTRLNLHSRKRAAFGDSRQVADIFVSHAKVALGYAQEVHTLRAALATRTVVGDAIGIIMSDNNIDEERAFELLIRVSRRNNRTLRLVADEIVETEAQTA